MKYIVNLLRVFVGLLFIFSGLIKSNDPTGFSYKLDEYFSVFAEELETSQDTVLVSFKSENEEETFKFPINPNNPISTVKSENTAWVEDVISDDGTDTLFRSIASISLQNTEITQFPIFKERGDTAAYAMVVTWSLNGKSFGADQFDFEVFNSRSKKLDINTEAYVKANSPIVDFLLGMRKYALVLAIFLCVLEIFLGLALLIGWAPKFTMTLLILTIVFFTFLTWYSATFNKVTDCGCFGDAIKLTPWESFYKDLILSVSLLIIALGLRHIKAIFSKPFAVKLLTVCSLITIAFSVYCWHYLPVKNFLKFKKGNNIEELAVIPEGAPSDVYENIFIYAKDGLEEEFTLEQMSDRDLKAEGYEFVDRKDKLISEGYEPEIHDFKIMDESRTNDYAEDFFSDKEAYKILIVMNDVNEANVESLTKLKEIIKYCRDNGIDIYPLTASNSEVVEAFRHENQLDIPFYYGDKTNLKSIIRSNPGLVLFKGNVVVKNWPSTRLPSQKRFAKKATQ